MFPLAAPLITGAASLLGGFMNSTTAANNTQQQIQAQQQMQLQSEQFNAAQVQQQEGFQEQMSNTAYQRASQDMQKAGLNPAMMFGSGSAASTPSGASASVGTPSVPLSQRQSPFQIGTAVSSAVDSMVKAKTMDEMTSRIAQLDTSAKLLDAERRLTDTREGAVAQDVKIRTPSEMEAQGVANLGAGTLGTAGKIKYLAGSVGDVIAPIVSSATGAGRVAQAFRDLSASSQRQKIEAGNFIGKYGTPIDEYLSH